MEHRHTIQKELVLEAVRKLKSHVTAEEVYEYIQKKHPSVGKGTVYRNLHLLAEEGEIKKIEIPDGSDRYDFTTTEHYHVRCIKCDRVMDVDMELPEDMNHKIKDTHGVKFLSYDILFKGICQECQ